MFIHTYSTQFPLCPDIIIIYIYICIKQTTKTYKAFLGSCHEIGTVRYKNCRRGWSEGKKSFCCQHFKWLGAAREWAMELVNSLILRMVAKSCTSW